MVQPAQKPLPPSRPRRSRAPLRHALQLAHSTLSYGTIPLLLVVSFVAHVQFRRELQMLMAAPDSLSQLRALLWTASSIFFFARIVLTPRGQRFARFGLLLLSWFCILGALEEIRWGGLLPFTTQADSPFTQNALGFSILDYLQQRGIPATISLVVFLGCYLGLTPFLIAQRPDVLLKKQHLLQLLPTPRLALWLLIATLLASGFLGQLSTELGRLFFAIGILLTATTPRETRVRYPWPDSASGVLFLLGTFCYAAVLAEPYAQEQENTRLANLEQDLLLAISAENNEQLIELLKRERAQQVLTTAPVLARAVSTGNEEVLVALLERGADPDAIGVQGKSALELAVEAGRSDLTIHLLWKDADTELSTPKGTTPLIAALRTQALSLVNLLLAEGADPNAADARGYLPIIEAARANFPAGIQRLIEAGVDSRQKDIRGDTALSAAPEGSDAKVFLMSALFDNDELGQQKGPPMLAIVGNPSMVWQANSNPKRLAILSVRVKNFGRSKAENVEIALTVETDTKEEKQSSLMLQGPKEIAAQEDETYLLTQSITAELENLHITSTCTRCESSITATIADFVQTPASQ